DECLALLISAHFRRRRRVSCPADFGALPRVVAVDHLTTRALCNVRRAARAFGDFGVRSRRRCAVGEEIPFLNFQQESDLTAGMRDSGVWESYGSPLDPNEWKAILAIAVLKRQAKRGKQGDAPT